MKPAEVAEAIVHGLEYGLEEVYPGDMAMGVLSRPGAGSQSGGKTVRRIPAPPRAKIGDLGP